VKSAQLVAPAAPAQALLRLLRPNQWIKNTFVLAGSLFGASLSDLHVLTAAGLAFVSFCLMGSAIYVLNDYMDREADRQHPTKRLRPLASGEISVAQAGAAAGICLVLSLLAAWAVGPRMLIVVLLYLGINTAYSLGLKQQAVLDVFCIASGFMLRIIAGSWGINISPTGWMIFTGMFITLFLGFAKRRAEWVDAEGEHKRRKVLASYSQQLLDSFLAITATGTVLSYGLYTLDPRTVALHGTDKLIYTLPFVLFGLFRYLFLLHSRNRGENPSSDVFTDGQIILCGLAFVGTTIWLLNR
jgi:4-hydroxybenzoate polyprenyltransferase